MDGSTLSISALKSKVSSKLAQGSDSKKAKPSKKDNSKSKKDSKPPKKDAKEKPYKNEKSSKKSKPEPEVDDEKVSEATENDILRREAMALGASEDVIKMLEDVDDDASETEFSNTAKDSALSNDVSNFMKGLNIPQDADIEESEDEVPEEPEKPSKEELKEQKKALKEEQKQERREEKKKQKEEAKKKRQLEKEEAQPQPEKKPEPAKSDKVDNVNSVISEKLRLENRIDWYNIAVPKVESPEKLDRFALERLTEKAQAVIDSENRVYLEEFTSNHSQKRFLSQILAEGTLNDKISALTLLVQEAPLHNLKAFDTLLSYCEKKSRTAALQAINALKDLLINGLLPDRKLLSFKNQALSKDADELTLALYLFEDHLKKSYFKLIQILEHLSHDPILHVKMTVVSHIFDLLKAKPEQEANLLRLGVNKLGDIENKVASKTSFQLLKLEEAHPAMKKIIVDNITDSALQRASDYNAQYFTVLTLNQTILTAREPELANALVKTYFSLFEKILLETDPALKDEADKTVGQSERGRKNNRKAFKKGKKGGRSVKVEEKTETEVIEEKNSKLFSALLTGLNRAFPFADLPSEIFTKHLDTLYKITHSTNFNTAVQALVLVQQVITQQDLDSDRYYRTLYESLMDPRLVNSSKQGIYLNLLFKSLKNDIRNVPRILAFVKRILQVCSHWLNIGAITGMLFLLMELSKTHPQILELMEAEAARPDKLSTDDAKQDDVYDPKKRDPTYANAQASCLWEMTQFTNHYHPTVAIYANSFIEGKPQPKPELGLYTLAHFLDRFVYKNAKEKSNLKGSSIMQPLGGGHLGSLLVRATGTKSSDVPMNTVDWLSKKAEDVRPDEKFFYDYFTRNEKKIRVPKAKTGEDDDELDDDQVWNALVKSKPDVEGSDVDDDLSDFSDGAFDDMSDLEDGDMEGEDGEVDLDGELSSDGEVDEAEDGEDASEDEMFGMNSDEQESGAESEESEGESKKRKGSGDGQKKKKVKLSGLPMFASVDDYSQYLQSDEE